MMTTSVTVLVSVASSFLSSNRMPADRFARARRVAAWRAAGFEAHRAAINADPRAPMTRARLEVVVIRSTRTHSDADNVQPSAKAARDGAKDAGMVPDDCDCHIAATTYTRETIPGHPPALRFIWTPALEEDQA